MKQGTEQREKTSRKITSRQVLIIGLIVLLAIAAVLFFTLKNGQTDDDPAYSDKEAVNAEENAVKISTPVGDLAIPHELADSAKIEDVSENGQYVLRFFEKVSADQVLLFEISFGTDENGYKLGNALDSEGNEENIWLNISAIEKKADWSEDEFAKINNLQSYVNDIIDQINQLESFQGRD